MKGARARLKAGFCFNVQKKPLPESSGASLVKKPHHDFKPDDCQGGRKSVGSISTRTTNVGRKRAMVVLFLMCHHLYNCLPFGAQLPL